MRRSVLVLVFFLFFLSVFSQDNLTVKFFGLSIHPDGDVNADNMPTKIDRNGIAVINLGLYFGYENFIYKDKLSLKIITAYYSDCGGLFSGLLHVGLRGVVLQSNKFSINGGIGPTFIYRRSWYSKFDNYVNSGFYNGNETDFWQYKFLWYAGELEFNYKLKKFLDLSVTLVPGYPKLIDISIGVRYRFGKLIELKNIKKL
ncbi:MAG: hypothetical protein PF485_14230 [Bacteroidales bacterium]|jgi:hypothetical protein|nr:hypothetical protein [Bacteroidales bacterium]